MKETRRKERGEKGEKRAAAGCASSASIQRSFSFFIQDRLLITEEPGGYRLSTSRGG